MSSELPASGINEYHTELTNIKTIRELTASGINEYHAKLPNIKTIGEFKALGREMIEDFGIADREAIDLLNGRNEISILTRYANKRARSLTTNLNS